MLPPFQYTVHLHLGRVYSQPCDVTRVKLVFRFGLENSVRQPIDTRRSSHYPRDMPMVDQHIRIGQVWKKVDTEETFLVTKLYNEALSTIAVLRPTGAATESMVRVRVERRGDAQTLPGYSMAQGNERA
jgi:hypothetical protein